MALIERLRQADELRAFEMSIAHINRWDLAKKFKVISSAPRAQPSGFCGLKPHVAYSIERFEVQGSRVFVHINYPKRDRYLLPTAYPNTFTKADIKKSNPA
jgi:hypothetical protein